MSLSDDRGFTLIEILIAIVMLAFFTIAVVNITENASQTMERTTEVNKNNLQAETAMSRFEWDFSQIYSPLYFSTPINITQAAGMDFSQYGNPGSAPSASPTPPGGGLAGGGIAPAPVNPQLQAYYENLMNRFQVNEHFSGVSKEGMPIPRFYAPEKTILEFFTSSNRRKLENTRQSHFAWVRYSLAPQADDDTDNPNIPSGLKSFVRYFTADDPYDDKRINVEDSSGKIKGAVLLKNVEKLEFSYWNYDRKTWESNIKAVPQGENALRGVKINLTWYDSQGLKRTTERVFRSHWPMVSIQDPAPGAAPSATPTPSPSATRTGF